MKIEFIASPSKEERDFLERRIDEDVNKLGRSGGSLEHIGFFIKNDSGEILGGCNGFVLCGAVYTDQLWVHESLRGRGFGRRLMESMHDYGRKAWCKLATLTTIDFQGKREFYEHLGYKCDLERDGYSNCAKFLFFKKEL
jgi:GNAT superfamily N-acetyltransferase